MSREDQGRTTAVMECVQRVVDGYCSQGAIVSTLVRLKPTPLSDEIIYSWGLHASMLQATVFNNNSFAFWTIHNIFNQGFEAAFDLVFDFGGVDLPERALELQRRHHGDASEVLRPELRHEMVVVVGNLMLNANHIASALIDLAHLGLDPDEVHLARSAALSNLNSMTGLTPFQASLANAYISSLPWTITPHPGIDQLYE